MYGPWRSVLHMTSGLCANTPLSLLGLTVSAKQGNSGESHHVTAPPLFHSPSASGTESTTHKRKVMDTHTLRQTPNPHRYHLLYFLYFPHTHASYLAPFFMSLQESIPVC